jgi:N-acyl homoserine lactone hydrolase
VFTSFGIPRMNSIKEMNVMDEASIKQVSMVSTGSVSIHPEHVSATRKPMYWWLFTSRRWTRPLPINVYVIEHRDGLVLFDTGQDRASVTDPNYFPGGITGVMYGRLARFDIGPEQTLTAQLAAIGYDIGDVHTAVISHLHQDHIGGLRELTGAQIVVSRREWETFTTGHDMFGDGSMVLLPTPGHTPGSLSMLVRRPGRTPLLMVGDLTYDSALLERGQVPGVGEKRKLTDTTQMINRLRLQNPGLAVLAAHDPGAASSLIAASS